ncbi:MAG: Calx-beta domain-containing protein [Weeksellaceae bacterium]
MKNILLSFCLLGSIVGSAQVLIDDTGADNATPESSAVLELKSNDKGLLLPRLSQAPADPVAGMLYYDTTNNTFMGYNGGSWVDLSSAPISTPTEYIISITDPAEVTEGDDQIFTLNISPALKAGDVITVDYITSETTPVSATMDSDFVGNLDTVIFNTPGQTSQDVIITTTDDTEVESTETYTLDLSNATASAGAQVSISQASAIGSILDNDVAPAPTTLIEIVEGNIQSEWSTYFQETSGYVGNSYGGVRLGSGSKGGVITYNDPITFPNSTGTVIVTIDVKGWDADELSGRINVGNELHDFTVSVDKDSSTAETVTHTFTNVPSGSNLSFESTGKDKRFMLYSIKVETRD